MKKITNTALFGKLAMFSNPLILGMFIIAMVCLMSFDKVNTRLISETPYYDAASRELSEVERPRRQAQAEVDYYLTKFDTLAAQPVPTDKKKAKEHQEEIERTANTLENKKIELEKIDAAIQTQLVLFEAIKVPHFDLIEKVDSAKKTFMITIWLTILFFVAKVIFFATWTHKNMLILRATSPWMNKSTAPFWAYLGWFIPIFNFIKPYSVFAETFNETNYILLDKKVIEKDIDTNADFNIGLWWGLLIMAVVVMSYILSATFFEEGPMFLKFSHLGVAITAIAFWTLYILQETFIIAKGIKMNRILFANRPKFGLQ